MNRPAVGQQSLRGIPNGFASQQQLPQNRSVSSRLPPSGKMAGNGSSWAFGGGVPMGSAGLGNPRPNNAPLTSSFAQTIGGTSQATAPLDPSEFPSLSNNQPQPSQSTWAVSGSRTTGPPMSLRLQQTNLSSQHQLSAQQAQQTQEDLFSPTSQISGSQGAFRFGNQNPVGQSLQATPAEEFPPLNRNAHGEIGQDRNSSLMQNVGFGGQSNGLGFGTANPTPSSRNNGLLNALSGSNRAPSNRVASPTNISGLSTSRSPVEANRAGQSMSGISETDPASFSNSQFGSSATHQGENHSLSAMAKSIGAQHDQGVTRDLETAQSRNVSSQHSPEDDGPETHDPLAHMSDIDKFGIKGFTYMMHNYPDYAGLVTGTDITNLGFDLNSSAQFSNQIYSLFDNEEARPTVPHFVLPECYKVMNIAQLESKMDNFNDEALMFMFYSNPGGLHQMMAATQLHQRNWRYHKKLQAWLTKDEMMVPQQLGNGTERGSYIFFDIKSWSRERRELTLVYDDLEQNQPGSRGS